MDNDPFKKTWAWHRDQETYAERQARIQAAEEAEAEALARPNALRQALDELQAEVNAKRQAKARADFDALGKETAKATTRAELVELGRKRADLAPHTGISHDYEKHCWSCTKRISSAIHAQCPNCKFYICSSCGSCLCGFLNY